MPLSFSEIGSFPVGPIRFDFMGVELTSDIARIEVLHAVPAGRFSELRTLMKTVPLDTRFEVVVQWHDVYRAPAEPTPGALPDNQIEAPTLQGNFGRSGPLHLSADWYVWSSNRREFERIATDEQGGYTLAGEIFTIELVARRTGFLQVTSEFLRGFIKLPNWYSAQPLHIEVTERRLGHETDAQSGSIRRLGFSGIKPD